jgi:hypothetical protein
LWFFTQKWSVSKEVKVGILVKEHKVKVALNYKKISKDT